MARDCKCKSDSGQSSARGSGSKKASGHGAKKQECFKCGQPGHFARLQGSTSRVGQGSSVVVLQLQ